MHRLTLLGSDELPAVTAAPHLHGLYAAPAPGGCSRVLIAYNGRVLLDAVYHPADLSDDDLRELHAVVTARLRKAV